MSEEERGGTPTNFPRFVCPLDACGQCETCDFEREHEEKMQRLEHDDGEHMGGPSRGCPLCLAIVESFLPRLDTLA